MEGVATVLGPFVDLPDHTRDAVLALSRPRHFGAGQMLIRRGEPASELMIIQQGLVAVHATRADGRRLTLAVCGPEEVLGEMALAGVPRRTASVMTIVDTDVLGVDVSKLHELRDSAPELDRAVMTVMADTIRRLTDQVLEVMLLTQATRLRRILSRLQLHFPGGRIAVTQEMLAEMLGAPRTTVTHLLADAEAAGLVAKGRGFVQVLDAAALRASAEIFDGYE